MRLRSIAAVFVSISLAACQTVAIPTRHEAAQQYWDGQIAPSRSIGGNSCTATMRAELEADYAGANRPEMMALGDSLYNGVQSLRINWWLSEWSPPSLIAIRLGLIQEHYGDRTGARAFFGPQYPSYGSSPDRTANYGFNLEDLNSGPLQVLQLLNVPRNQAALLQHLTEEYQPPNGRVFVDNLAFSGANSIDIESWTAGDFRTAASAARRTAASGILPNFGALGDAFTYSNAAFVLNPTRNTCVALMTPLDQVLFRKPKRLFVNIGANNGIFRVAFSGATISAETCNPTGEPMSTSGIVRCDGTISHFLGTRLIDDLRSMGEKLIASPGVEHVYLNGIAKPSRPANVLLTRTEAGIRYHTDLFTNVEITPEAMAAANTLAWNTNESIRHLVDELNSESQNKSGGPVFHFVDVDKAFEERDYKECLSRDNESACQSRRVFIDHRRFNLPMDKSQYLDNRPMIAVGTSGLTTGENFDPKIAEGGLFSFDNMHLSSIGYELLVEAVRYEISKDDPLMAGPRNRCRARGDADFDRVQVGDCRWLLVTPGYAYADATRRAFIFQRTAGEREMRSQEFLKSMYAFASSF